ncbi:MAG: hypothetical protein V3V96_15490 [Acidiferrobacterales bacterium]
MTAEAILALVRHGLTTLGGALVTGGLTTETDVAAASGAFVIFVGFAWSVYRKWARLQRTGSAS